MNNANLKLLLRAAKEPRLGAGSFKLLFALLADGAGSNGKPFPLTWRRAGGLCGISDKATIYARIYHLESGGYLKRIKKPSCPPSAWFKVNYETIQPTRSQTGSPSKSKHGGKGDPRKPVSSARRKMP